MNELTISLVSGSKEPIYEQIYNYIKNQILEGNMEVNYRLPSTRALSKHLMVSRSTVEMAYEQLVSEGYIEAVACKGYFVTELNGVMIYKNNKEKQSILYNEDDEAEKYQYDFSPRGIDLDSFPYNAWRKVTRNILMDDNKELFNVGSPQGDYEFRRTISSYLFQARGAKCSPEQIIVGAGNEYLLMLVNQIIDGSCKFAMENPTYKQAYRIFGSVGRTVVPVNIDRYGMDLSQLSQTDADVAYVMPSHQFPTGIVMPVKRRNELLLWANEKEGRYIIEDDYDSEFRYKGKTIPSLLGSDLNDKVIYIGTFSRSIAPAIRMSYMVLPYDLLMKYRQKIGFYTSSVSRVDQRIVNAFINDGHYERHLNKMRATYKNKKDVLVSEIRKLGPGYRIIGEEAGIHILVEIDKNLTEEEIVERLKRNGIKVYPLSDYYIEKNEKPGKPTILLGYAVIGTEEIKEGIRKAGGVL